MNIAPDCVSCIFSQALRVTKELGLDEKKSKEVLDLAGCMVPQFSLSMTPPQNATPMYEEIAKLLGKEDLYAQAKQASIQKAEALVPYCKEEIQKSQQPLVTAMKIAVAGNVIDLASEYSFDLEEEIHKVLETPFAIDESVALASKIAKAKRIVYLADNAGENVFDRLYIERIKADYPEVEIYYFVRTQPIINDICYQDLKEDPIHKVATVIDSGIKTPGLVLEDLLEDPKEIFTNADLIISKGMGNYECLSEYKEFPIYYLLKVKCHVVAKSLELTLGDLVCKNAQH